MKLLLVVLIGTVVLLHLPDGGHGECCTSVHGSGTCMDCKKSTPCCGRGRCNIFCCNCDNGCRYGFCKARRSYVVRARDVSDSHVRDVITAGDMDGDGRMSLEEAREYLAHRNLPEEHVKRSLQEMDLDGDWFLSPGEIDHDSL